MTRFYSSVASEKELSSPIDNSTQTIPLDNVTGLPNQFPYTLVLDHNTSSEEIVNVTAAAGNNLTADRGVDGTVALSHEQGAKVVHAITARDLQESRDHEDGSTDVHGVGVANSVVGTNTVQTLEGKTIDGGDNTLQNVPQSAITDLVTDQGTQDSRLSTNEGNISSVTSDVSSHVNDNTLVHGVIAIVGSTEAQTLTNKTINAANNTLLLGNSIDFGQAANAANVALGSGFSTAVTFNYTPPAGWGTYKVQARGHTSIAGVNAADNIEAVVQIDGNTGTITPDNAAATGRVLPAQHSIGGRTGTIPIQLRVRNTTATRGTSYTGWLNVTAIRES